MLMIKKVVSFFLSLENGAEKNSIKRKSKEEMYNKMKR